LNTGASEGLVLGYTPYGKYLKQLTLWESIMKDLNIRKARLDDLETLLEFEQGIIEYERPMVENMKIEKYNYYDLSKLMKSERVKVLVAELDGKLIASGFAKIERSKDYLRDEHHAYLGFMYVVPEHRGKGINQLIVEKLKEWSQGMGMEAVRLTVFAPNQAAIRAYQKAGFKQELIEMRLGI